MENFLDDKNAAYDALAKKILSGKAILAHILKYSVKEFSDCTLEDIEGKYIEGDPSLTINTIPLDDTIYIKGRETESKSPNEDWSLSILFLTQFCRPTKKLRNL